MSHRFKYVKHGEKDHTGKDEFEEVHIYRGSDCVEKITGPKAKIEARQWVSTHNWRLSGDNMKELELPEYMYRNAA